MKNKLYWRTNENIRAPEMRVIGADGKQIGVVKRNEALKLAKEAELDLVEIAPKAQPPVAKVVNFGKFRYAEEKKLRAQKKSNKAAEVKEIRFSPFIAEGDYNTRFRRMDGFLKAGHKIRVVVVFKGRQMGSKKFGYKLMEKILVTLGDRVVVDMKPKFLGRHLAMVISPLKKKKKPSASDKSQAGGQGKTNEQGKTKN